MTKPDPAATLHLLDYLVEQVHRLGDDYTAALLGNVAEAQGNGAMNTTAALKLLAGLLAHEDPAEARRAEQHASRRMAIAALVNELDIAFGRGMDVSLDKAHTRLRRADPGLPRERVADALRRRHLRDTGQPYRAQDGRP